MAFKKTNKKAQHDKITVSIDKDKELFAVVTLHHWDTNITCDVSFYCSSMDNFISTIYGCRVIEGKKGQFLAFPSRQGKDGNYYKHAFINQDIAEMIIDEIDEIEACH